MIDGENEKQKNINRTNGKPHSTSAPSARKVHRQKTSELWTIEPADCVSDSFFFKNSKLKFRNNGESAPEIEILK